MNAEIAMIGSRVNSAAKLTSKLAGWLTIAVVALATPALAHHPMGGAMPETFMQGFLSGLGHPVIGLDHLAFIVAVGITSAVIGARLAGPSIFIGATLIGCLLALNGTAIAQAEWLIAASVLLVGLLALTGTTFGLPMYLSIFAVAGVLHGGAYAEAVVGAEATPIGAYLFGFAAIQFAIAAAMAWITRKVWNATTAAAIQPRLAGAVVTGVGAAILFGHAEKIFFPGIG
jgi:urease accessory protein